MTRDARWRVFGLLSACSPADRAGAADRTNTSGVTASLDRGINITAWFRFPASRDPAALAAYLSDQALADLRACRLRFRPPCGRSRCGRDPASELVAAIRRIQRQGLTVVVSPHPHDWHLETSAADRDRLRRFWQALAPALRRWTQPAQCQRC